MCEDQLDQSNNKASANVEHITYRVHSIVHHAQELWFELILRQRAGLEYHGERRM